MNGRHFALLGLVAVAASLASAPSRATEGGASLYVPGIRGPLAGVVPPPGFYFNNDFYAYSGEISGGRRIQIGGAVLANVKVEARADFATASWITPLQIFGGHLGFGVSVPFGVPRVSAGVVIEAPRLGRTFAFSARDSTFNFGDPLLASFVQLRGSTVSELRRLECGQVSLGRRRHREHPRGCLSGGGTLQHGLQSLDR